MDLWGSPPQALRDHLQVILPYFRSLGGARRRHRPGAALFTIPGQVALRQNGIVSSPKVASALCAELLALIFASSDLMKRIEEAT